MPELTVYLDVPSEVGLERIASHRQDEVNRLDKDALSFHQRTRSAYLDLASESPSRWVKIDATQPLENVVEEAVKAIENVIK
jgi:dTMP kinase